MVAGHNLLVEEYPLATRDLRQIDEGHWLLDTEVCDYVGIGRFTLGLMHDIRILTPEFEEYIRQKVDQIKSSINM